MAGVQTFAHPVVGLSLHRQVIYYEEYARARAPGRIGHIGETLLGPTIIAFGTDEQRARFLPGIVAGTELWCQGYSEPGAGSDLANVQTRASVHDGSWVSDGQKEIGRAAWRDRGGQEGEMEVVGVVINKN